MRTKVQDRLDLEGRPTALDVGCGPGLVMELFSSIMDVEGVDIDPRAVERTRERGLDAIVADAQDLPFDDNSFDIVYCSFMLLWVERPQRVVAEMARVSRHFVVFLAEPDYGGRICHPREVADLDRPLVDSIIEEGADPFIGRRLGSMMEKVGLRVETGVHSGVWSIEQIRDEAEAEWYSLSCAVEGKVDEAAIDRARRAWDKALADGTLFLYNPVFYAVGRKR